MNLIMSEARIILRSAIPFVLVIFLFFPFPAFSEEPIESAVNSSDDQLEDELKYLQEETYVITPSRIPQRIEKAPGSIYVVTDKMIYQMGARYLKDVIDTVPGWSITEDISGWGGTSVDGATGTASGYTLFMINSLAVTNPYYGSGGWYQFLDLDNVKRIEFVTGPGSALYGSGAIAGIVNIITKEGQDVDGLQVTGRGGSFNTWEGNALFGKKIEGFEIAAYLDYMDTDGFRGHVDRDMQTLRDQHFGTHSSLAPGNMKGAEDRWDGQLTMKYRGFKFDGKYNTRKHDMPFGYFPKLDNRSFEDERQYYLNLSYDETVMEGMDLMAKVYRVQFDGSNTRQVASKGSPVLTPSGGTIVSDDLYSKWKGNSRRTGMEAESTYEIWDDNTIVGGIALEQMEVYNGTVEANYTSPRFGVVIPLPSLQTFPGLPDKKRELYAAYLEDIWDIMDDLRLTIGGRYDHYSDVGGQLSPRVGINWDFAENYYAKFLYGKSFRAPSFVELYDGRYGNPDLEFMTKDSYQLSFGLRFLPSFTTQVTGFYYKPKNVIGPVMLGGGNFKYINYGKTKNKGFELQMKYDFGRGTYLSMNYTYIDLELRDQNNELIPVSWEPTQLGTLSANIRLNKYLNLNAYLLYRGDWARANGDTRDDPGDYALVNATLIAKNFSKKLDGLEVRAAVKNLLNKDYITPTAPELPDDMPMPGINFFLEMRYAF